MVEAKLKKLGYRTEVDERSEKIGYKIRAARNERVPYILVVGEKEEESDTVSVRRRDDGENQDLGTLTFDELLTYLEKEEKAYPGA